MKKLSLFVLVLGAVALLSSCTHSDSLQADQTVYIVSTNDVHANVLPRADGIDLSLVAALKQRYDALLLDAGDALQGAPLAIFSDGADVISLMNCASYDAMVPGNHEFDYWQDQLLAHAAAANFPLLSSNVKKEGKPLFSGLAVPHDGRFAILENKGYRLGIFALTTRQTEQSADYRLLTGLEFENEVQSAKKMLDLLRPYQLDAIIALAHLGNDDAPCTSRAVAQALDGAYQNELSLIIDGHSHQEYVQQVNGVTLCQSGSMLNKVGLSALSFEAGQERVQVQSSLLDYQDLQELGLEPDVATLNLERKLQAKLDHILSAAVIDLPFTLFGGELYGINLSRVTETAAGDLAADSIRYDLLGKLPRKFAHLPVVAVQNGGNIRVNLGPGTVSHADLLYFEPFLNPLISKLVSPQLLYEVFEHSYRNLNNLSAAGVLQNVKDSGGFLQVSGIKVVLQPNAQRKIKALYLEGETEPLSRQDTSRQIILAGNDFILAGADGYTMLRDIPVLSEFGGEQEALISYLSHLEATAGLGQYAAAQGRLCYEELTDQVTVQVRISTAGKDADGFKQGKALHCSLNGGDYFPCTPGTDGLLQLRLSPGAYSLKVAEGGQEIYLTNAA